MGAVEGSCCLDLFAGSGALGFEAHSRGAAHTTLVDSDRQTVTALRDNAERFSAGQLTIVHSGAIEYLRRTEGPWDLVFLDPPYDADLLVPALAALRPKLAADARVYCETRTPLEAIPGYDVYKVKRLADTTMTLMGPA